MLEREPFNEIAAEHILGAEVSDLPPHRRFGDGRRFATPSGRNLDVFDGAVGINGIGMQNIFDASDLTPVYEPDSVGFVGTVGGMPFSMTFHGDTGGVTFDNMPVPTEATVEESPPLAVGAPTEGQATEPAEKKDRDLEFIGRLKGTPQIDTTKPTPWVKPMLVGEPLFEEGKPLLDGRGRQRLDWHHVQATQTSVEAIARGATDGTLRAGTTVYVKGYEKTYPPRGEQRTARKVVNAVVFHAVPPQQARPQG